MIRLFHLTVVGCLAAGLISCKIKPAGQDLAQSPEAAYTKFAEAGRTAQAGVLYDLLHTPSRWAVMSIFKDQKAMCALILAHYPTDRQAAAVRRCQAAQEAKDDRSFFGALARERGFLRPLAQLRSMGAVKREDTRAEIESAAGKLAFCKEDKGWGYCGFLERLERLKIKTARDLTSAQENAEAFKNK